MNTILQDITNRTSNIGSLVLLVKNNSEYLDFINHNVPESILDRQLSEKIYYLVNNINTPQLCRCGKHLSFIGFKNGYRKSCGDRECYVSSRKETCIEKFGVDNPKKSKIILEKEKENILKKWNGEHFMMNKDIKDKFKKTMIDNWGVEWAQQNKSIKDKSLETWNNNPEKGSIIESRKNKLLEKSIEEKIIIENKKREKLINKFGSYGNFINFRKEKIKESSLWKHGTEHHLSSPEIIKSRIGKYKETITQKILESLPKHITYLDRYHNENITGHYIKLHCRNCDEQFSMTRQLVVNRINSGLEVCSLCNPILVGKSKGEEEVFEFISSIYRGQILQRFRIDGKEIDIYLPDLKIGFEYNGLFWHSNLHKSSQFHLEKTKFFEKIGIKLIHIWEDDWLYKREIIKSIISNKIGATKNKIFARKCQVREVDNSEVRSFLESNHIQSFVGSRVKLGLFHKDELVSIMTFGSLRKSLSYNNVEGNWELLRFCNKLDCSVIGGASKLFNHFLKVWKPSQVISFCDYSRSDGNIYKTLGFELQHLSTPNYYYIVDGIRKHRFNYRKDKLVANGSDSNLTESQIMQNLGINKIYDCGMQKWIFIQTEN